MSLSFPQYRCLHLDLSSKLLNTKHQLSSAAAGQVATIFMETTRRAKGLISDSHRQKQVEQAQALLPFVPPDMVGV